MMVTMMMMMMMIHHNISLSIASDAITPFELIVRAKATFMYGQRKIIARLAQLPEI